MIKKRPKISIIVPIYNTGKFLPECIDSILNQTFSDWELILINDGSPDNSDKICRSYIQKDKRIRYYYQKNQGVSVARNLGIQKASGQYIYFMDSDDSLNNNFLETSYRIAIQKLADIIIIGKDFKNRFPNPTALPTCAMMVKKAFLNKYPEIRYPKKIQPCEDGLFSHQLLALTKKVAFNPMGIYNYRQHENSNHATINKSCDKLLNQIPQWFKILTIFYDKHHLWEKRALHLLKFLEHEPFELRMCAMPFNIHQKEKLFNLIHGFYQDKLANHLTKAELHSTSKSFQLFLKASEYSYFEKRYTQRNKLQLFLIKLIPLAKIRHRLEKKIKEKK